MAQSVKEICAQKYPRTGLIRRNKRIRAIGQSANGAGCPFFGDLSLVGIFGRRSLLCSSPQQRAVLLRTAAFATRGISTQALGSLAVNMNRRHSRECSASVPQELLDLVEFLVRQIKILLGVGGVISLQGGIALRQIQLHTLLR